MGILEHVWSTNDTRGNRWLAHLIPYFVARMKLVTVFLLWLFDMYICLLHPGDKKTGFELFFFPGNCQDYNVAACAIATDHVSYQHVSAFSCIFCIFHIFLFCPLSFVLNASWEACSRTMHLAFGAKSWHLKKFLKCTLGREMYARRWRFWRSHFGKGPCWFSMCILLVTDF